MELIFLLWISFVFFFISYPICPKLVFLRYSCPPDSLNSYFHFLLSCQLSASIFVNKLSGNSFHYFSFVRKKRSLMSFMSKLWLHEDTFLVQGWGFLFSCFCSISMSKNQLFFFRLLRAGVFKIKFSQIFSITQYSQLT